MLTAPLAHVGRPQGLHDLFASWQPDPLIVAGLLLTAWAFARGRRAGRVPAPSRRRAAWPFWAGLATLVVALVSPLHELSEQLASAHMVQHVLVVLVAAPLLALSAPAATMLAGLPRRPRRLLAGWRARAGVTAPRLRALRQPALAWLAHVAVLWLWHSATLYELALGHPAVHGVEHVSFLLTGLLFWRVVIGFPAARPVIAPVSILLVFTMALQSVFLAALLTFATEPWYAAYATTAGRWGLEPLADQQLAGAIMWVPAGLVYVGAGVTLLARWLSAIEVHDPTVVRQGRSG